MLMLEQHCLLKGQTLAGRLVPEQVVTLLPISLAIAQLAFRMLLVAQRGPPTAQPRLELTVHSQSLN